MTTKTTVREFLTDDEAAFLTEARILLDTVNKRLTDWVAHEHDLDRGDALSIGQAAEATNAAEDAVFNCLNALANRTYCPAAKRWVLAKHDYKDMTLAERLVFRREHITQEVK